MSNARAAQWANMVATGGADNLFDTYPDDEELAATLNGLLRGDGEITASQVCIDRQRFHELPRRGEMRDERVASPTKFVIYNKARQLNIRESLAEILDNIFDNFERNDAKPKKLEVAITVYPPTEASPAEIVIRENSGGIPNERIGPLVQLGASDRSTAGIGAWGEGFKMAVFALGAEIEVFSSYGGEPPIAIVFPKGWLEPNHALWKQWKVEIFGISRNAPPVGTTIIVIKHLHPQVVSGFGIGSRDVDLANVCAKMADYFGEVYSEKYHCLVEQGSEVGIDITVGNSSSSVVFFDKVEARLRGNLAFLPWMRPIKWSRVFEAQLEGQSQKSTLEVTIYAGLAATENYSSTYAEQLSKPGVEMWGNGRKFSLKGRITDESAGWGFTYGGRGGTNPSSNASYRRLTIVALFNASDSRDVPWAAPVKNDYNRRSEFYAEIQSALARAIKLFKDAHTLLEFVLLIFSQEWNKYDFDERLSLLFSDVESDEQTIKDFSDSRFGRKVLAFDPPMIFKEVGTEVHDPTLHSLYGIESTQISDIVKAAVATKHSAVQRIEFLKAIFPSLARQAEIEEKMGLAIGEEFTL
jgi:hypothetical protein